MAIRVLYFAALRESLDCAGETLELPEGMRTLGALREHLHARGGAWSALAQTKNLRAAVNRSMAQPDSTLADGDEVAFFPPVTGG